jgi:hypothetical protein
MNVKQKIAAVALSGAIVIGGSAAAFAGSNGGNGAAGTGSPDKAARITALCAHKDDIIPHLTERQTKLTNRIAKLDTAKAAATTAGHPKVVDRITKREEALTVRLAKVDNRLTKAPDWIAAHCN